MRKSRNPLMPTGCSYETSQHTEYFDRRGNCKADLDLSPPLSPQAVAADPSSTPVPFSTSVHPVTQPSPSSIPSSTRKRRRPSTHSSSSLPDPVIGHVTLGGTFRCLNPKCQDISFGRQADFRRHYEHTHVAKKVEYYCPVDGCQRSRKPAGKSKGRSFGTREDKMREHFRTVHEIGKRRKMMAAQDGGGTDVNFALSDEETQKRSERKRENSDSEFEEYGIWDVSYQ